MSFTVEVLRQDRVPVPSRPSAAAECGRCGAACWLSERASDYLAGLVIADDVEIVCANCNAAPGKEAWHLGMMIAFDTETTGTDPECDRLVSACLAWIDGLGAGAPVVRNWLVDPGIEIPEKAAEIHGITTGIAQAEGMSPAPVIAEICEELIRAADDQVPIVAFNACFDLTLLDRECRRNGMGPIGPVLDEAKALVVDPFVIDKQIDRFRKGSRTLTAVAAHYGVRQDTAHSASGDAITAARVAWRIAARNPRIARMGPTELHAFQVRARREQARSYADHLRGQGDNRPVDGSWPWKPWTEGEVAA